MDIAHDKNLLRAKMRFTRENLSKEEVIEGSLNIFNKLTNLQQIINAKSILVYKAIDNEVDLTDFTNWCLTESKLVYFPFVNEIKIGKYGSLDDLIQVGKYYEPNNTTFDIPEVALIPGLAFTKDGLRLGQGKGWYDRYLQNKKIYKIGLCFQQLVIKSISHTKKDIKVDCVITNE